MFTINQLKRKYDQISKYIEPYLAPTQNISSTETTSIKVDQSELYRSRKRTWEQMIDNHCDVIIYKFGKDS